MLIVCQMVRCWWLRAAARRRVLPRRWPTGRLGPGQSRRPCFAAPVFLLWPAPSPPGIGRAVSIPTTKGP